MKTLITEILINADTGKVWQVLTDFPSYPDWNPFIKTIKGDLITGSRLNATMKLEGRKEKSFRPWVISVTPGEKLCWREKFLFKGLFDGTHYFTLEKKAEGKTNLIHGENFKGLLTRTILRKTGAGTLSAFEHMNEALKDRAEKQL